MNVLIVGANTKMAKVFSLLPSNVNLLLYNLHCRYLPELANYSCTDSITNLSLYNIGLRINEIRRIVQKLEIDILVTNTKLSMIEAFLATRFLNHKPLLMSTSHNSYAWAYWHTGAMYKVNRNVYSKSTHSYSWVRKFKIFIMSRMIDIMTDGYIALASFVSKILITNGVKSSKVFLTSNPIESSNFPHKISYKKNSKIPNILYISVIYEGKGHLTLINAMILLKVKGIHVKLTIAGDIIDHRFYNELLEKIKEHGLVDSIDFIGEFVNSELRQIMSNFDIYVCPSQMEMSPINILEAKAAGLPIIATNVGGIPDILTHEIDGMLIPPNNENAIADAITLLANDENLCARLGTAAYNATLSKHSPANISLELNNFLLQYKLIR